MFWAYQSGQFGVFLAGPLFVLTITASFGIRSAVHRRFSQRANPTLRLTYPFPGERLGFPGRWIADQSRTETEVNMASTHEGSAASMEMAKLGTIDMGLEVVTLPVSDVDRAKRFYQSLGWRLDIDLVVSDDHRTVQFTPPHSQCSIHFGKGLTAAEPGSADRLILAVKDIDSARDDLISRGVDVSEVSGPDAEKERSYFTTASFSDPDGNGWVLQEITTRLPGREWED
jgi:catechol 2,3-dioxygenase-like lactoylglutathione lyase family enzyme